MAITVSNKDVEVLSEALFCYYFAIWNKGKKNDYDPSVWNDITTSNKLSNWTSKMGISAIVDRVNKDNAFTSRLKKVPTFLIQKGWHKRLVAQVDKFFSDSRIKIKGSQYNAMRADMLISAYSPYRAYNEISKKVKGKLGFKGRVDKDKWNPSDVWILTRKAQVELKQFVSIIRNKIFNNPEYCVAYMNSLNNKVRDMFRRGQLFPVSLKAPSGAVKIVFENDTSSNIKKVVRFTELKYEQSNQDAKIGFSVDKVDSETGKVTEKNYIKGNIKTKTVKSGGARLEIEGGVGSGARYGSMGTENYQWLIKETDKSGINFLNSIRNKPEFKDLKDKYWGGVTGKEWLGRGGYVKEFNKDPQAFAKEIEPYTQALYQHVNRMPWDPGMVGKAKSVEEAWLNKTHAGEVGIAVNDIMNKIKRDITVENLFNLAASQGFGAGVSKSQITTRIRMAESAGKKIGGEFNEIPIDESNKIWSSCFYMVVK